MKIKLALFEADFEIMILRSPEEEPYCSYPRVSEYVEVEFPMLDDSITTEKKIVAIDKEIEALKDKAMRKVTELQAKKQALLVGQDA